MIYRTFFTRSVFRPTEIILLVLMLWPAPIPSVHYHSGPENGRADRYLVQHLELHHGGLENARHWPEDWHWHWSLSGDGYVGLIGEQVVAESEGLLDRRSWDLPLSVCSFLVSRIDLGLEPRLATISPCRQYSFQSVALLHSRQSLPELLGVMRL